MMIESPRHEDPPSRRETCAPTGKVVYRSPERAEKIRKLIRKKSGDRLSVFRCDDCRFWHLGHSLSNRRRKPAKPTAKS
jgi:hypothetical protein